MNARILNLLTREHFKNMSDNEADNFINAFFAGCENIDFYDLIKKSIFSLKLQLKLILRFII